MWPEIPSPWLQMQQRRGGLLSRARPMTPVSPLQQQQFGAPTNYADQLASTPQPERFAQPGQTPIAPLTPTAFTPQQPAQMGQAPPPVQQPKQSIFQRMEQGRNQIDPQTWFQIAGGFLDKAQGDGTWGQALGGVGSALEGQSQRNLQQEELGYMRDERGQVSEERRRRRAEYERVLADPSYPPDVKAAIRAAGPDAMSEILGTQVMSAGDKAQIEFGAQRARVSDEQWKSDMDFRREDGRLNRVAQNRGLGLEFGMGRYFQSQDAQFLGDQTALSAQIQSVGLPSLLNVQQTIGSAREIGGVAGQPLGMNERVTLGRLFNGSGPGRPTLEVWRAQVLTPALESMRGLGAMTEKEFEAAMSSFANPNMTLEAAETLINQKVTESRRRVATADAAQRFAREAGGITGVNNKAGQNFGTFLAEDLERQGLGGAVPAPSAPSPQAEPQSRGFIADIIDSALNPKRGPTAQQITRIPPDARRAMLSRMNDPQARAAFDQQYGAGSAEALRRAAAGR